MKIRVGSACLYHGKLYVIRKGEGDTIILYRSPDSITMSRAEFALKIEGSIIELP